jgi:hypothetical protein
MNDFKLCDIADVLMSTVTYNLIGGSLGIFADSQLTTIKE